MDDLLDKNFVVKLSEASPEAQAMRDQSDILHFYCWEAVIKDDSVSTPVRMVVDFS